MISQWSAYLPGQQVRSSGTSIQGRRSDGEPHEQGIRQLSHGMALADALMASAGGRRECGWPEGPSVPTGCCNAWYQILPSPTAHSAEVDLSTPRRHLLCLGLPRVWGGGTDGAPATPRPGLSGAQVSRGPREQWAPGVLRGPEDWEKTPASHSELASRQCTPAKASCSATVRRL